MLLEAVTEVVAAADVLSGMGPDDPEVPFFALRRWPRRRRTSFEVAGISDCEEREGDEVSWHEEHRPVTMRKLDWVIEPWQPLRSALRL
jgi:hypothetical protein